MPISVVMTGLFSCLEKLNPKIVLSVDTAYDVKLGLLTAPLQSLMLEILLSDDTCLVFSSSATSTVRSRHAA